MIYFVFLESWGSKLQNATNQRSLSFLVQTLLTGSRPGPYGPYIRPVNNKPDQGFGRIYWQYPYIIPRNPSYVMNFWFTVDRRLLGCSPCGLWSSVNVPRTRGSCRKLLNHILYVTDGIAWLEATTAHYVRSKGHTNICEAPYKSKSY